MTALEFIRLLFKCSSSVEVRRAVLRALGMSYTLLATPDTLMREIETRLKGSEDNYSLYKPVVKTYTFMRNKNSQNEEYVAVIRIGDATVSCQRKEYSMLNVPAIPWTTFEQLESGEKTIEEVYATEVC